MPERTVLVLGGGVGGVVTATHLRRLLPREHRVVLIEREPTHRFAPSLLWILSGAREPRQIERPISGLARRGIEVVQGEIEALDPRNRSVTVGGRQLQGDFLVLALGAELAPELIPGLQESGHSLYSLDGALALRDRLRTVEGGRVVVLTAAPAYKCPAAPYEAALLLQAAVRHRDGPMGPTVTMYAAEPGPMGTAGPVVSAAVRQLVESRGIGYHPDHQVERVDPTARQLQFRGGASAEFDLLAYVPPHRAPRVVRDAGLTNASGWIAVDRDTLRTEHDGVFAIGDVTTIPLSIGKPLPKAGVFAHAQGHVVARNLAREITGQGSPARFDGKGACVIEAGNGRAGFGQGDFFAEPAPTMRLHPPARRWHWGKVLVERHWLWRWF